MAILGLIFEFGLLCANVLPLATQANSKINNEGKFLSRLSYPETFCEIISLLTLDLMIDDA